CLVWRLSAWGKALALSPYHDLARPLAERFPIIAAIDGLNAESCGQEKQLEFAREEDVHIEFGEVAFVRATFKILLMRPQDMLQLLDGIVSTAGIEQHGKFSRNFDL